MTVEQEVVEVLLEEALLVYHHRRRTKWTAGKYMPWEVGGTVPLEAADVRHQLAEPILRMIQAAHPRRFSNVDLVIRFTGDGGAE